MKDNSEHSKVCQVTSDWYTPQKTFLSDGMVVQGCLENIINREISKIGNFPKGKIGRTFEKEETI